MSRTRRYIFDMLTVVSLLLLLATVGLWVDSQAGYGTVVRYGSGRDGFVLKSSIVGLWIELEHLIPPNSLYRALSHQTVHDSRDEWGLRTTIAGFSGKSSSGAWGYYYRAILPHWFLTLIFAIGPAIWLFKWNKRRKLGPNACPGCGYDLTGNESGECPECGAVTNSEKGDSTTGGLSS
jgi:hypothetical protein